MTRDTGTRDTGSRLCTCGLNFIPVHPGEWKCFFCQNLAGVELHHEKQREASRKYYAAHRDQAKAWQRYYYQRRLRLARHT